MKLIAEIGQVHEGSLGLALKYIEELAKRNVDTIKFQMHLPKYESSMYEKWRVPFSKQDNTRKDYWERTSFTFNEWKILFDYCAELNVEFLCTPFSLTAVDWLEQLNVKRYKIGSADWNNLPLLDHISKTQKPFIVSTGLTNFDKFDQIFANLSEENNNISLMYCVTAYPAEPETIDLNNIEVLKKRYMCDVGYSDHSGNYLTGLVAFFKGADFYEFHITSSYYNFGPDVVASLDFAALDQLQNSIKYLNRLGTAPAKEKDKEYVSTIFSRSLGIRASMNKGDVVTMNNIEVKKPSGIGLEVGRYKEILGCKVNKALESGSFLKSEDLDE